MKQFGVIIIACLLLSSCNQKKTNNDYSNSWASARWIGYEKLEDSLKILPAVHGLSDTVVNDGRKRSVVPMFRKTFSASGDIEHASINICGLGHYELYINGEKAGKSFLSPGWTLYQKRCLYNTYDITELIKTGDNALGVLVGNGFFNISRERYRKIVIAYGYPRLIFNIEIKYKDGSVSNIVSDEKCKVVPSPITFSSIYGGEDYNATMEQAGWNTSAFDDTKWNNAVILEDSIGKLFPEEDYPLQIMEEFNTKKIFKSKTGRTIYDFGQNASGIISLKVKGNKGTQIRIKPDELLDKTGNITQYSCGSPYELNYTLKGEGEELWQPRFTYYGFRYADVEIIESKNADTKTEILEMTMLHTRNSSPVVGSFSCSDSLFNKTFELINWGIKSNMASVATDCPHREKLGWLEQSYLMGPSIHYNYDIHSFYVKIINDMMDSQLENGMVPDITPEYVHFDGGFRDSPEWGSAAIIIPWQVYKWYGDTAILRKAYPMMKKYVEYLQTKAQDHILDYGLGDWYDLGPNHPGVAQLTPIALTATSIYFYDVKIISVISKLFGYDDDLKKYNDLSEKIRTAFLTKFFNPKTGLCSTGSQTSYAMPLYTGIIPDENKESAFINFVKSIEKNDYALTAGDIGYHFVVCLLSENGRSDILYKMNNRSDRPGYGYQLKKGATSLTESWDAITDASNNHMMLGHLMEWFYSGLGGIYQEDNSTAYNNIIIAPKPVGNIKWVKCSYISCKGLISSEWEIKENTFSLKFEIPSNASARIIIPEDFRKSDFVITDIIENKPVDVKIDNGAFIIKTGKYILKSQ